jgi:choline-glycine betaine transporter
MKNTNRDNGLFKGVDISVFAVSAGFMLAFVGLAIVDMDWLGALVRAGAHWASDVFGAFWQLLLLVSFVVALVLALGRTGQSRLGGSEPEISNFKWVAIIMCTLLAGGGVFWAAAEPVAHFLNTPPYFGADLNESQQASAALAQSFMHWGFLAWTVLGSLSALH